MFTRQLKGGATVSPSPPKPGLKFDGTKTAEPVMIGTARLVSLLDMLHLDATTFLSALSYLGASLGEFKMLAQVQHLGAANPSIDMRAQLLRTVQGLSRVSQDLGLTTTKKLADTAFHDLSAILARPGHLDAHALANLTARLDGLIRTAVSEAEGRKFYVLQQNVPAGHDDADELFGTAVVDAFPDAQFDISEAGKCLAFGLWTASAMHMMRVLECGLRALARHVDVPFESNWNKVLNQVETKLRSVRRSIEGAEAEEWAAEAGTHLRFIKNAWRNQAMHTGWKTDEQEARQIFANGREFMQHLAEKVSSDGPGFTTS